MPTSKEGTGRSVISLLMLILINIAGADDGRIV